MPAASRASGISFADEEEAEDDSSAAADDECFVWWCICCRFHSSCAAGSSLAGVWSSRLVECRMKCGGLRRGEYASLMALLTRDDSGGARCPLRDDCIEGRRNEERRTRLWDERAGRQRKIPCGDRGTGVS